MYIVKDSKVTAAIQVQGDAGSKQDSSNGAGVRGSGSGSVYKVE